MMSAPSYKYAERHKTMPVCWKLSANLRRFARNLASIDRSIDVFDVLGYKNRWGLRSCPHIPKFNSSDRETKSSSMSLKLSLSVLFVAASAVQAFDFFTSGKLLCRHRARKESLSPCLHCKCNTLVEKKLLRYFCAFAGCPQPGLCNEGYILREFPSPSALQCMTSCYEASGSFSDDEYCDYYSYSGENNVDEKVNKSTSVLTHVPPAGLHPLQLLQRLHHQLHRLRQRLLLLSSGGRGRRRVRPAGTQVPGRHDRLLRDAVRGRVPPRVQAPRQLPLVHLQPRDRPLRHDGGVPRHGDLRGVLHHEVILLSQYKIGKKALKTFFFHT